MLFDDAGLASCWRGCRLGTVLGMVSARRRVGNAVGPVSSWRCVRPSIEMKTLSAQRRAGDSVGPASSCDGEVYAVGPASDDTAVAQCCRRCLPGVVWVTLSATHQ